MATEQRKLIIPKRETTGWTRANRKWEYQARSPAGGLATGGTMTIVNGYRYHTFTTTGTLDIIRGGTADILIVAGGGSGGSAAGAMGGGGAGGLIYLEDHIVSKGSLTMTVGLGGAAVASASVGNSGEDSVAFSQTAIGGGGGATGALAGTNGGSGGGGGAGSTAVFSPGLGTSGQGHPGGSGFAALGDSKTGGGGGGAGSTGGNGGADINGNGGIGRVIFGSYYAGGGGAASPADNMGAGGLGGGGAGSKTEPGESGTVNTGGGGGAGGNTQNSGAGGSGIIIIRYRI